MYLVAIGIMTGFPYLFGCFLVLLGLLGIILSDIALVGVVDAVERVYLESDNGVKLSRRLPELELVQLLEVAVGDDISGTSMDVCSLAFSLWDDVTSNFTTAHRNRFHPV